MNLDGINAKKGSIYQDNKYLKFKIQNLIIFPSRAIGGVKIKNSDIFNSEFKTGVGNVEVNNSKLKIVICK